MAISRSCFSKEHLLSIRKDLQLQLITLSLQRIPAFIEFSQDHLLLVASSFVETFHKTGDVLMKCGETLGKMSEIFVVQSGNVSIHDDVDDNISFNAVTSKPASSLGSRLGSLLMGRSSLSSTSQSPRGSVLGNIASLQDSGSKTLGSSRLGKVLERIQSVGSKSPRISSCCSVTTYGVLGIEVLPDNETDESCALPYEATAVVQSAEGCICLSVSLSKLCEIVAPIHDDMTKLSHAKVLRKVPCLEYLTAKEIEVLSHTFGIVKLQAGSVIYKTGDAADRLYVVLKGAVFEYSDRRKSKEEQVIHSKGSFFGEQALFTVEPRSTTTIAGDAKPLGIGVELLYLDRAVFEANFGSLEELNEERKRENERKGIVRTVRFEDLEIVGLLGTGLFGKVNLVYCRKTNEHYALKAISKEKVVKLQEEDHIRNEKMLMECLNHPFVAKLVRTFKDQKHVYLLQELTIGKELFALMESRGCLQEWETAFYAGAILLALEYMHEKGIVYRDLKPENTLIGENGYPKLIDLGFAKKLYNHRTYSMCGTPDYMAPEIIRQTGHGKAVDYWALGCMIYEMITNISPFNRFQDPPQVIFQRAIEGRIRFPTSMSPEAVDIIRKLLDPNPDTRLGCRERGTLDIKEHAFFAKYINFQRLYHLKEDPPMIPPKIKDYSSICCKDKLVSTEIDDIPIENENLTYSNWDDIF